MTVRSHKHHAASLAQPLSPLARLSPDSSPGPDNEANGDNAPASVTEMSTHFKSSAPTAVEILRAARSSGLAVTATGTGLRLRGEHPPTAELVALIRAHKTELVEILTGHRCRECGEAIVWRRPGAVAFADGTAAHLTCHERQPPGSGCRDRRPHAGRDPHPSRTVTLRSSQGDNPHGPQGRPAEAYAALAAKQADVSIPGEVKER